MPLQWAATQNNLGNALQALGEREGSTERLLQAIAAHHDVIMVWKQRAVPESWVTWAQRRVNELEALTESRTAKR